MDGRKGWQFETMIAAVTLLNLGFLVNAWRENLYYNAIQMIANARRETPKKHVRRTLPYINEFSEKPLLW